LTFGIRSADHNLANGNGDESKFKPLRTQLALDGAQQPTTNKPLRRQLLAQSFPLSCRTVPRGGRALIWIDPTISLSDEEKIPHSKHREPCKRSQGDRAAGDEGSSAVQQASQEWNGQGRALERIQEKCEVHHRVSSLGL
jgi:hypothetical protein